MVMNFLNFRRDAEERKAERDALDMRRRRANSNVSLATDVQTQDQAKRNKSQGRRAHKDDQVARLGALVNSL